MFMNALQRLYDVRSWGMKGGWELFLSGSVYLPGITDTSQTLLLWDNTFMDETLGSFHGRGG